MTENIILPHKEVNSPALYGALSPACGYFLILFVTIGDHAIPPFGMVYRNLGLPFAGILHDQDRFLFLFSRLFLMIKISSGGRLISGFVATEIIALP